MLPKKGIKLRAWRGLSSSPRNYAEKIADALKSELGGSHRTIKTIMRWTGSSEKTAKNWLGGETGPSGHFLIRLCIKSAKVRELILQELAAFDSSLLQTEEDQAQRARLPLAGLNLISYSANLSDADGTLVVPIPSPLNNRQVWFLERVGKRIRSSAEDISQKWGVSSRTAKRDISSLKEQGLIHFVGARRNGHYALSAS
jgi:HTH domain